MSFTHLTRIIFCYMQQQQPSGAPVIPIKANIITTLRNVPARYLTPRESEKFLELALTFLQRHTEDSMGIEGLELYYQKAITMSCDEVTTQVPSSEKHAGDIDATEGETTNMKSLQSESNNDEDLAFGYYYDDDEEEKECQVMGMEVTLIAKVSSASLPHNLGSTAAAAFEEHEQEFLDLLHEHQAFYTFFKNIDGISAVGIEELTPPPTESPTTYAYYLGNEYSYEDNWEPIIVVEVESTSMPTPNPPSNADKVTNEGNIEKTTPSPTPGPTLIPSSDATMYYCRMSALSFIIAFLW